MEPKDPMLVHFRIFLKDRLNDTMAVSVTDQLPGEMEFVNSSTAPASHKPGKVIWNIIDVFYNEAKEKAQKGSNLSSSRMYNSCYTYFIITFPKVAIKRANSVQAIALRVIGTYLYFPTGLRSGRGIVKKTAKQ